MSPKWDTMPTTLSDVDELGDDHVIIKASCGNGNRVYHTRMDCSSLPGDPVVVTTEEAKRRWYEDECMKCSDSVDEARFEQSSNHLNSLYAEAERLEEEKSSTEAV